MCVTKNKIEYGTELPSGRLGTATLRIESPAGDAVRDCLRT